VEFFDVGELAEIWETRGLCETEVWLHPAKADSTANSSTDLTSDLELWRNGEGVEAALVEFESATMDEPIRRSIPRSALQQREGPRVSGVAITGVIPQVVGLQEQPEPVRHRKGSSLAHSRQGRPERESKRALGRGTAFGWPTLRRPR
jgi:hypothetical protein